MDWLKGFLNKWGLPGLVGLIALIAVAQNAGLVPAAHEVVRGKSEAGASEPATSGELKEHAKQTETQTQELKGIRKQLEDNRNTQATGLRTLCIISAKTETQRLECAKIQ